MVTRAQLHKTFDTQFVQAEQAGKLRLQRADRALSARYDARAKRLHVELASGAAIAIPVARIQGLSDAPISARRDVRIEARGLGLRWPALDLDLDVPRLVAGCFGNRQWMSALARHAGSTTSEAKARAARENGKKGGRPRTLAGTKSTPRAKRKVEGGAVTAA